MKMEERIDDALKFGYEDPAFIHDIHVLIGGEDKVAVAKAALLEAHRAEMAALLERVENEVIGYDEEPDTKVRSRKDGHKNIYRDSFSLRALTVNKTKAEQRTALAKLKAELDTKEDK